MTSEFAMVIAYGRSSGMGRRCGWHENMTGYMALRLPRPNIYPAYENAKSLRIIAKAVQLLRKSTPIRRGVQPRPKPTRCLSACAIIAVSMSLPGWRWQKS